MADDEPESETADPPNGGSITGRPVQTGRVAGA